MKPVYLGMYAYEQVQGRIYACEGCISAYKSIYARIYGYVTLCKSMLQIRTGNLMHSARLLWPLRHQRWYQRVYRMICLLNWGSTLSLSLGPFWLMSDAESCAEPAAPPRQPWWVVSQNGVSSLSRPAGSAQLPVSASVPCDPNLSQPAIFESESLCNVGLGKITETIHLLPQMCTSHKIRCKTY